MILNILQKKLKVYPPPMGDSEKFATNKLMANIGLVKTKSGQTIPIEFAGGNTLKQKSQL